MCHFPRVWFVLKNSSQKQSNPWKKKGFIFLLNLVTYDTLCFFLLGLHQADLVDGIPRQHFVASKYKRLKDDHK